MHILRPPTFAQADALAALIDGAERIVAFTGAGVSTECGVPDFRSPDSPWRQNKPIAYADFLATDAARRETWRRKFTMDDAYAHARPGRGHRALAHLMSIGKISTIITQNIDNLHLASGAPRERVIELHGNGSYATCLSCGRRYELAVVRAMFAAEPSAPTCTCGGFIKSATVAFGQAMPAAAMRAAQVAALDCDLCLAIGSSLVVFPAAGFPVLAQRNGAKLVILNGEPTHLDASADLVIHADIGAALAPFQGDRTRAPVASAR